MSDVIDDAVMLACAAANGDKAPFWGFDGATVDELRELIACQSRLSAWLAAVVADQRRERGQRVTAVDVICAARSTLEQDHGEVIA